MCHPMRWQVWNPTQRHIATTLAAPLYYAGLSRARGVRTVRLAQEGGATVAVPLEGNDTVALRVDLAPRALTWFVVTEVKAEAEVEAEAKAVAVAAAAAAATGVRRGAYSGPLVPFLHDLGTIVADPAACVRDPSQVLRDANGTFHFWATHNPECTDRAHFPRAAVHHYFSSTRTVTGSQIP